jgi:hypothetical protein
MKPCEFIEYYEKYLLGDIEVMMEKADEQDGGNQMAVPVSFSIFSALDKFGFLLRNTKDDCELRKDTTVNIATSLLWSDFGFPEFDIQKVPDMNEKNRKKHSDYVKFQETALYEFIDIYRNGIIHNFFPKYFSISNDKNIELNELFFKIDDNLVFNVRKFFFCFNKFILKFNKELETKKEFNLQVEKNIKLLANKETEYDVFHEKISKIEKFNYSYCITTSVDTTPVPNQKINNDDLNITGSLG